MLFQCNHFYLASSNFLLNESFSLWCARSVTTVSWSRAVDKERRPVDLNDSKVFIICHKIYLVFLLRAGSSTCGRTRDMSRGTQPEGCQEKLETQDDSYLSLSAVMCFQVLAYIISFITNKTQPFPFGKGNEISCVLIVTKRRLWA